MWTTILAIMSVFASTFFLVQLISAIIDRLTRQHRLNRCAEPLGPPGSRPIVTVVIPAFNEHPGKLMRCIRSVLDSVGIFPEIIVIDDGSIVPVDTSAFPAVKLIRLDQRRGKRHAQAEGFRLATGEWIATVDSDTFVDEQAIYQLLRAAITSSADAVSGTISLANADANLLTSVTSLFYWFAYHLERASQSLYKNVCVCSGALSLYRTAIVKSVLQEYVSQNIFGRKVEAGDDRYLTMLTLLSGHKVVWSPLATAATTTPERMGDFIRQQVRWNRSFYATLPAAVARIRAWTPQFAYFLFRHLFRLPYNALVLAVSISLSASSHSVRPFFWMLLCVTVVALIKGIFAALASGKKKFAVLLPLVAVPSLILMTGVMAYAFLTPAKAKWTSRLTKPT